MASSSEFHNNLSPSASGSYADLLPRATSINDALTSVLEKPDWDITRLHFQAPFGPDYQLGVEALTSNPPLSTPNYRRIGLFINPDSGYVGHALYARFDYLANGRNVSVLSHNDRLASLLRSGHEISYDLIRLVADIDELKSDPANESTIYRIGLQCANLLMQGCVDYRQRTWHTLADGTKVYLIQSRKDGEQPWPEVDYDSAAKIRVQTPERIVDFRQTRAGIYQTFDSIPDRRSELSSVVGESMVLGSGDNAVEVSFGDNHSKHAVVEEAESAMGLRALNTERLDVIEDALTRVAAERSR